MRESSSRSQKNLENVVNIFYITALLTAVTFKGREGLVNEDSGHSWLPSGKQQHWHRGHVHIIKIQIHPSLIHFKPETTPKGALLPSEKTLHIIIEEKKIEFKSLRANKPCSNLQSY